MHGSMPTFCQLCYHSMLLSNSCHSSGSCDLSAITTLNSLVSQSYWCVMLNQTMATSNPAFHSSPAFHCHKVCITGQAGVGKTSTFMRIKTGKFRLWSSTNIHADTYEMTRLVNGEDISVSKWTACV